MKKFSKILDWVINVSDVLCGMVGIILLVRDKDTTTEAV